MNSNLLLGIAIGAIGYHLWHKQQHAQLAEKRKAKSKAGAAIAGAAAASGAPPKVVEAVVKAVTDEKSGE